MMNKTLNVVCSVFCGESDRQNVPYLFPLGIVYCASSIQQLSFCSVSTFLFDSKAYYDNEHIYVKTVVEELRKRQTDIFCVSGMSNEYVKIKRIIDYIKVNIPHIYIIIGGGIVSANPRYVISHILADYGIAGEGEKCLQQLLEGISCGKVNEEIAGLVFRRGNGEIVVNEPHEIMNLDDIPFPDYSLFPEYEASILRTGVYPMLISRSCPYHCTFCFHTCGEYYRTRSPSNCICEIERAVKKYGIKHIFFFDELFGANTKALTPILEKLHSLHISFNAQTRADFVSDEIAQLLFRTGCTKLSVGIESASNHILKSMNKNLTIELIQKALETILRHRIRTSGNIIIGDLNETKETAQTSISWFNKYRTRYNLSIGMIQCYPGTKLYEYAKRQRIIVEEEYLENAKFPNDFVLNLSKMSDEDFELVKRQVIGLSFLYRESPDIY